MGPLRKALCASLFSLLFSKVNGPDNDCQKKKKTRRLLILKSGHRCGRENRVVFYPKTHFNSKHLKNTLETFLNRFMTSKNAKTQN
jgi:hypothetical protein